MNELIVLENKKDKLRKLIIYFFVYAFIGWTLETIYAFLLKGKFVNRGFLIGPLCPIYGFGAVILILLLGKSKGKPGKEFLISVIAFTIFEYMVSYILEAIFGLRWWDYSKDFLNLQGRVSLAYSFIWGAMGIILIEIIHPYISKKLQKIERHINKNIQRIIIYVLVIIFIIDVIASSVQYLKC